MALAGRDFNTVEELMNVLLGGLPSFHFSWSHLMTVWNWKALDQFDMPTLRNLHKVHVVNLFRSNGIWVKWKQYMTSEEWSRPVLLIPAHEMAAIAAWRPAVVPTRFSDADKRSKFAWLDKFESVVADGPDTVGKCHKDVAYLKTMIEGNAATFTDGPTVDQSIFDLKHAAGGSVSAAVPANAEYPHDVLAQYFISADHPEMPVNTLISVPRRWEPPENDVLTPGCMIIRTAPPGTTINLADWTMTMPILVAQVVDCSFADDTLVLLYWLPQPAPVMRASGGKKKMIPDVFGPWIALHSLALADAQEVHLPDIIMNKTDILEVFDMTADDKLPYRIFDKLRTKHGIDMTGLSLSQTHLGNIYRAHVLMA